MGVPMFVLPPLDAGPFTLRSFALGDVGALVEATTDPLIPLITTVPSREDAQDLESFVRRQWERTATGLGYSWAIANQSDDQLVGQVGLWPTTEDPHVATAGYWVLASQRGKGAAYYALQAVAQWAMSERGIERIDLGIDASNIGSIRTAERVGFHPVDGAVRWEQIGTDQRALRVYTLMAEQRAGLG